MSREINPYPNDIDRLLRITPKVEEGMSYDTRVEVERQQVNSRDYILEHAGSLANELGQKKGREADDYVGAIRNMFDNIDDRELVLFRIRKNLPRFRKLRVKRAIGKNIRMIEYDRCLRNLG